jgi:arylsulfatase A-like enzyme
MRRGRTAVLCAALLLAGGCGGQGESGDGERAAESAKAAPGAPNIVVVMTDDQDAASVASMEVVQRELVDEGVEFVNSFVGLSECCPSRVSFLTGQHAHNHGVETSKPPDGGYPAMDSSNTLAVWLDEAGYRTGEVGRYVNFYGNSERGGDPREIPPGWDEWHVPVEHTDFQVYDYVLNENGELVEYGSEPSDYATDVFAGKAVEFIESAAEARDPFFLWVTPNVPHKEGALDEAEGAVKNPRPAPQDEGAFDDHSLPASPSFAEADLSDKPAVVQDLATVPAGVASTPTLEQGYRGRMESLLAVDRMVDRILEALRRTGELRRTFVIFTSDNGFLQGEHRQAGKHLLYEESVRVPLVIRGPGIRPGTRRTDLVQNIDLAPTISELASADAGLEPDGIPLVGPGAEAQPQRDLLLEYPETKIAFSAVRTPGGFVYAEYERGERELYDLTKDPHQLENVADAPEYTERQRRLAKRLAELEDCAGEACR